MRLISGIPRMNQQNKPCSDHRFQRTGLEDNCVPDLDIATVARGLNALRGVHERTYHKGGLSTDAIEGGKLDSHSRLRLDGMADVDGGYSDDEQRAGTRRRVRGRKKYLVGDQSPP